MALPQTYNDLTGELHRVRGGAAGGVCLVLDGLPGGGHGQDAALLHGRRHRPVLPRPLHHRVRPLHEVRLCIAVNEAKVLIHTFTVTGEGFKDL